MSTNAKTVSRYATKQIILVGLFGALSTILMLLEFSLPFIPPFVKMDFSELPVILGGYLLGPLYGAYIAIVKVALNFVLNGTTTFGIGETVNLIGSLSFMLPAVFYYKYHRTFKGAITSLVIGTTTATVVLLTANYFVIFPLYATAMHFPIEKIVALAATTNPFVTNLWTLMLFALLPFNVLKFGLSSVLSLMLYKKVEKVLKLESNIFSSGLKYLNFIRNMCAHDERLYNSEIILYEQNVFKIANYLNYNLSDNKKIVVSSILYLKLFLNKNDFDKFYCDLKELFDKYKNKFSNNTFELVMLSMGIDLEEFKKIK